MRYSRTIIDKIKMALIRSSLELIDAVCIVVSVIAILIVVSTLTYAFRNGY